MIDLKSNVIIKTLGRGDLHKKKFHYSTILLQIQIFTYGNNVLYEYLTIRYTI